jgi:hypothetical protein
LGLPCQRTQCVATAGKRRVRFASSTSVPSPSRVTRGGVSNLPMNECKIGADLHLEVMPQDGVRKYFTLSQPDSMRFVSAAPRRPPETPAADRQNQLLKSPKTAAKLRYLLKEPRSHQQKAGLAGVARNVAPLRRRNIRPPPGRSRRFRGESLPRPCCGAAKRRRSAGAQSQNRFCQARAGRLQWLIVGAAIHGWEE